MKITNIGKTTDGRMVNTYHLKNNQGMEVVVCDFGATLMNLWVPNRDSKLYDVVLGYDKLDDYENNNINYFGATIGRNANRIKNAMFNLDEITYYLDKNDGSNNLHSGNFGYQLRVWDVVDTVGDHSISFMLQSKDGDQGFPGMLNLIVKYELTEENSLSISYSGISDKETIFNPTNHSYFNLNGHDSGDILDHTLQINSSFYTPVTNSELIPTGNIANVGGTPMDFRKTKIIGQDIQTEFEQLAYSEGYDHNYILDNKSKNVTQCATLLGNKTGIKMEVSTNMNGIQLYTGNFVENVIGKNNVKYDKHSGVCLETQFYPNAINTVGFPPPLLPKNTEVVHITSYKFS